MIRSPHPARLCVVIAAAVALLVARASRADDWPTFGHDDARSAMTRERPALPLGEAWVWQSRYAPRSAWEGPAKEDKYSKPGPLKARLTYDTAFHVSVVGDAVYFGSSADDKVYCLDAATGRQRWALFTEGPVRFTPFVAGDRAYFGSDDGCVYCVNSTDGALLWKRRVGPADRRVPSDGRVISLWPVRTGVVVREGVVYCGAGVFPSEGVHLAALDARDGSDVWRVTINDLPIQGYILASQTRLYAPTGRDNPIVFDRASGKRLYTAEGQGGTYCLLTDDQQLIVGPGKVGQLGLARPGEKDQLATFAGNHMIVSPAPGLSYLHTDTQLSALDRTRYLDLLVQRRDLEAKRGAIAKQLKAMGKGGDEAVKVKLQSDAAALSTQIDALSREMGACMKWRQACEDPLSLILAGDVLFAGGDNRVAAYRTTDGSRAWSAPVQGEAHGLAYANGRLFVSTDRGAIHCFVPVAAAER